MSLAISARTAGRLDLAIEITTAHALQEMWQIQPLRLPRPVPDLLHEATPPHSVLGVREAVRTGRLGFVQSVLLPPMESAAAKQPTVRCMQKDQAPLRPWPMQSLLQPAVDE